MFNPTSGSRWPLLVTLLAVALVLLFGVSSGLARERISNGDATDTPGGDPVDSNDYGTGGSGDDGDIDRGEAGLVTALDPDPVYSPVAVPEPVFIQLPGTWYRVPVLRQLPVALHRLLGGKVHAR